MEQSHYLLNKYPLLEDNISIHLSPKEGYLYIYKCDVRSKRKNSKNYLSFSINGSAQDLLIRFNGRRLLRDIIRELTDGEENFVNSIPIVIKFIQDFTNSAGFQFIKLLDEPIKEEKQFDITGDRNFIFPVHATLELTDKCNLRCNYCYRESDSTKRTFLDNPLQFLDELYKIGIRHVELSGGEPLLHPDISRILQFLGEKFNLVALLTNGILMNERILEIISQYKDKFVIQICLDGPTPQDVDKTTGKKGAFKRITKAIQLVSNYSIRLRVGMVIDSSEKIKSIEETLLLAKNLGATWFVVNPAINIGRGKEINLTFSESEANRFSSTLLELEEKYKGFFVLNREVLNELEKSHNCGAGHRTITIGPDKKVRPCPMFPEEFGILCDLKKTPIGEAFKSSFTEIFYSLKSPNIKDCEGCSHIFYCMNCFSRGLSKAKEIGYNCKWFNMKEVKELRERFFKKWLQP